MPCNREDLRVTETLPIVVKRIVNSIPVKKPKTGMEFFRIRPGSEWKFDTFLLDLSGKSEGEGKFLLESGSIS